MSSKRSLRSQDPLSSGLGPSVQWPARAESHLVLNGLVPLLDLSLERLDVFLQGLDDALQLHLLCLQELNVIGALFDFLLQAAELKVETASMKTLRSRSPSPTSTVDGVEALREWILFLLLF